MRKALFFIVGICLMFVITACSSAEEKELLEYHNSYIENVVNKMDTLDTIIDKSIEVETDEEALEIQRKELVPIVDEIKQYMDSQDPETDVTKEYHTLRMDAIKLWYDAFQLNFETLENYVSGSISEEAAMDAFEQVDEKFAESEKLIQQGNEKIDELAEKYNFEEIEDE